jgi:hypothetical protein
MQHLTFARLVRPLVLGMLLAVAVLFGTNNNVAWATSAQQQQCPNGQTACDTTAATIITVTQPSTPALAGAVRQEVQPATAAQVSTADGSIAVHIPTNAFDGAGTLEIHSEAPGKGSLGQSNLQFLGRAVEVRLFDASGKLIEHPEFANPVQVCFTYSADDLVKANGKPEQLKVRFYNTSTNEWESIPTTVENGRACGSVKHFTLFALTTETTLPALLPQTGLASTPAKLPTTGDDGMWTPSIAIWAAIIGLLGMGCTIVVRARQIRSR